MEKTIIAVPGIELFSVRSINEDIEFGAKIYDFIVGMLEIVGTEVQSLSTRQNSAQLFFYYEGNNVGSRFFEVSNEFADYIIYEFRNVFLKEIEKYGDRKTTKGKNVLFQLNNGELSATDFAQKLK